MIETDEYVQSHITDITSLIENIRIDGDLDASEQLSIIDAGIAEMRRKLHKIKGFDNRPGRNYEPNRY